MLKGNSMGSMPSLLNPQAVAVVGASQRPGRGTSVIANLRDCGFKGDIFAVNPRYADVLGYRCCPSVGDLPTAVDCIVVAVAAEAACDVLEEAYAHGIRAAVVLSAGFGEGGQLQSRVTRLRSLAEKGMCICGPNCFGFVNVKTGAAAFSGVVPRTLRHGPVALVSQSGSLGNFVFGPLMRDRKLGFSYFVSCGNQLGATVEDYVEYFIGDPDVNVIAAIVEDLKNPRKLLSVAHLAHAQRKSLVFFQVGKSTAGQVMIRSHTGALAGDSEVLAAFLRRCGIVQADSYDEFLETIELFANVPFDDEIGNDVVLVSGSGGGAAVAADHLEDAGIRLAELHPSAKDKIKSVLPEFGSVTNPIDATGAVYDDPTLMPRLLDVILSGPGKPIIAASVIAAPVPNEKMRRIAGAIADSARSSGRTIVAYQPSPLGPLDGEIVTKLHSARVPLLMGISSAMAALKHLPTRRDYATRAPAKETNNNTVIGPPTSVNPISWDFLSTRQALVANGVAIVDASLTSSEHEALAVLQRLSQPVALKAEAPGLLHKSDLGCVHLDCVTESDVIEAYRTIVKNARRAGFEKVDVLIQPMVSGVAEAYAGIINNSPYGPAIVFGLGGIFVEILKDTATEMAPLSADDAMRMIHRLKAIQVLKGARGRQAGDIEALATFLVHLSQFAVSNFGQFRALDLNPVIVKPAGEGVVAVDIAVEMIGDGAPSVVANAAS
jgi:acyl-CoA synthetase (NDP forming)